MDREITPYMPTRDAVGPTRSPFYGAESFTYLPEGNTTSAPASQQLNYGGRNEGNRTFGYIGTREKCGPCKQRSHDRAISLSCCSVEIAQFLFQKG
jgi:hypothetical protein